MTTQNKIITAVIVLLTIVFSITVATLNTKIESLNSATSKLDLASSTITVQNSATTTVTLPLSGIVYRVFQNTNNIEVLVNDLCLRNPTVEGCVAQAPVAPAMTSATSSDVI
jgi:hypothetical protein